MNTLVRTYQAYGLAVIRRSNVFRIAWVIVWTIALGGGSTVSEAHSNSTPDEKKPEQVVQPINFRQPDPLDFDDHAGYVRIFDGKSLRDWDGPAVEIAKIVRDMPISPAKVIAIAFTARTSRP